jgi:hypothetical protein
MRVVKKARQRSQKSTDDPKEPERPSGGKFAPIIEELGKMKSRLESGAVSFAPRPLSLQEKAQLEIEGELIQREQTVREDFGTVFRDNPQALVEFMAAMRKYGDDEVLRDLVFAAETLYGGEVDKMPGGVQFWEDLKKEVGTIPYEPGADADDERLHRILAVEILREAALSYDIISSEMEEEADQTAQAGEALQKQALEPAPVGATDSMKETPVEGPLPAAQPASVMPAQPPPGNDATAPRAGAEGRIHAQLELMARKDADIRQALVELGRRESMLHNEMERLQKVSLNSIDTEERLKLEREELVGREEKLLAVEKGFSEREKRFIDAEEQIRMRLTGHEEERGRLLAREQELSSSLEQTRALHARTQEELAAVRHDVEEGKKAVEECRLREEALAAEKRSLEEERARLADIHGRFEAQKERQGKLEDELARKAALQGDLDLKEKRLKVMEDEMMALRSELEMRRKELDSTEKKLKDETEKWERDLGEREDRLAARERELAAREARIAGPDVPHAPPPPKTIPSAPPPAPKAISSLVPPPSPPLLPHRKEPPAIPPPEPAGAPRLSYKVRCPGCRTIIVVSSHERPLKIKCANCGKEGVLK